MSTQTALSPHTFHSRATSPRPHGIKFPVIHYPLMRHARMLIAANLIFLNATVLAALPQTGSSTRPQVVDNPLYTAWSRFKLGSSATITTAEPNHSIVMIRKLVEVTPERIVLELKRTETFRGEAYPARIEKEELLAKCTAMAPEDLAKYNASAAASAAIKWDVKKSDEDLVVKGQKVHCHRVERQANIDGRAVKTTNWCSSDIPGGFVKTETSTASANVKTSHTSALTDFVVAH
jgi:hypothetical protein